VVVNERRRQYLKGGIPWRATDKTEAGRKRSQRDLEDLSEAGVVAVTRGKRLREPLVKLSNEAEQRVRAMCMLPSFGCSNEALKRLWDLSQKSLTLINEQLLGEFTYESHIAGDEDARFKLVWTEDEMLPLMARGLVEGLVTNHGHAFYSCTHFCPECEGLVPAPENPLEPLDLPDYWDEDQDRCNECRDQYLEIVTHLQAEFGNLKPDDPHVVHIHLCASSPIDIEFGEPDREGYLCPKHTKAGNGKHKSEKSEKPEKDP